MTWSESISLRGRGGPFTVLPPASELTGTPSQVRLEGLELEPEQYAARDPYPLPHVEDREGYQGNRHYEYWLQGFADYRTLLRRLRYHGAALAPEDRILDLGCASGRVLRHFACQFEADHSGPLEVWGADVNRSHVEWIQRYLPPAIRVIQNHALPHLPIEDDSSALVYGFSVFTHIDEFESAWLAEIRRILRPGGMAYLTIHSDRTWAALDSRMPVYQALLGMVRTEGGAPVEAALLREPMPASRVAFVARDIDRVYDKNVFHATDYVRDVWSRLFDVVEIYQRGAGYQDVILLRKPTRSGR